MSRNTLTSVLRRGIYAVALSLCIFCTYGCSIPDISNKSLPNFDIDLPLIGELGNNLAEVSPPELIQSLKSKLSVSNPRVEILEPLNQVTLDQYDVSVKLAVSGLKLFKDKDLDLGPHVAVFLDDQAPIEVFDLEKSIPLKNLRPGTHTLRAVVEYPWHESFKNSEAYAQTSFNVFTTSASNAVEQSPVLTTSSMSQLYTAEPILLDFVVRGSDPRQPSTSVKATLNDESFVIEDVDGCLYLTGLNTGQNWLKLELQDAKGRLLAAPFSEQLYGFEFQPGQSSSLSKILAEQVSLAEAGVVVGVAKPTPKPSVKPTPTASSSTVKPTPSQVKPTTPLLEATSPSKPLPLSPTSGEPQKEPASLPNKTVIKAPPPSIPPPSMTKTEPASPSVKSSSDSKPASPFGQTVKSNPALSPKSVTPSREDTTSVKPKISPTPSSLSPSSSSSVTPRSPSASEVSKPVAPESEGLTNPKPVSPQAPSDDVMDQVRSLRDDGQDQLSRSLKGWRQRFEQLTPQQKSDTSGAVRKNSQSAQTSGELKQSETSELPVDRKNSTLSQPNLSGRD